MKKTILLSSILCSTIFAFDLKNIANEVAKNIPANVQNQQQTKSSLDNNTISSGLKEALKSGVNFATTQLGKKDGYLNSSVKIPLPDNLARAETIIRKAGGDKMADDLIKSMNNAASQAAPKTADIFMNAISKMSISDAQNILNGGDSAATEYFKKNTTNSLKELIKPIIQTSMKDNSVAQYYDGVNSLYESATKGLTNNSMVSGLAKNLGVDTNNSNKTLDDFVTQKAIDGLFSMIAEKEAGIRENPIEQTSSILKQVFGK
ncbi:hypothetical protein CRU87_00500 [Aliarcobacter trophiarum LMG 25534]|uniref:DUF4197 domain-containing protein n=1 Tax=Aliarcobacter trophiarum LMG 25534 TaxID=1032241 RepID=A0AAD0QII0_9BACT|nr:DUF4197 domain-containing protein [Aliarcobacter trophiarum]AXK48326.1 DUF4197 domain-containing protein [Aliarcobacter trophiarum LMG 25534]RXI28603.1 hypothetical protein CRU89_01205 [Aliarcobacter trophiarum]RXJ92998.1 hypothetical protein CRU87_00500 [Aliarcobacter trophiarum LMG 25534]